MTAQATIRPAVASDLDGLLQLEEARRRQFAKYQPVFWRPAADAADLQGPYLANLIEEEAVITVVADTGGTLAGFAVGTIIAAPPVYDPGGPTCVIDDFAVAVPSSGLRSESTCWAPFGALHGSEEPHRSLLSVGTSTAPRGPRLNTAG